MYPKRKPNRLKGYDYSSNGVYFVTICTKDRKNLFWEDTEKSVGASIARPYENKLSEKGRLVDYAINNINHCYSCVSVDKYVIMPNHIHLLLSIDNGGGRAMLAPAISAIIAQMKGYVTKRIGYSIWQKLFHDHTVRNDREYRLIWQYIDANPQLWKRDCFYTL